LCVRVRFKYVLLRIMNFLAIVVPMVINEDPNSPCPMSIAVVDWLPGSERPTTMWAEYRDDVTLIYFF
jgi:hypothetical protein